MGRRGQNTDEVRREVDRSEEERLRRGAPASGGGSSGREAGEARELEAAGWERRGDGPKAIWRKPGGGRWWAHYQAVQILRRERLAAEEIPSEPGEGA